MVNFIVPINIYVNLVITLRHFNVFIDYNKQLDALQNLLLSRCMALKRSAGFEVLMTA